MSELTSYGEAITLAQAAIAASPLPLSLQVTLPRLDWNDLAIIYNYNQSSALCQAVYRGRLIMLQKWSTSSTAEEAALLIHVSLVTAFHHPSIPSPIGFVSDEKQPQTVCFTYLYSISLS